MKTLFMTRGLPASGKSSWAKEKLTEFGSGNAKRVSKDDLRAMLDDGRWSKENEKFVLKIRDCIVTEALHAGKHVIVDDTNLPEKHESRLRELAKACEAQFELVDFTHVPLEECLKRDQKRPNYVGEAVIRGMWEQFLKPRVEPPPHNPDLPNCVIVDIDGTIAKMNRRGPFEWLHVGSDEPRQVVIDVIRGLANATDALMIIVSGRDECCLPQTAEWIYRHCYRLSWSLYMRPAGDMRRDSIVKREIYNKHINGKYNVIAIFDDRPRVIRECWQALGYSDRLFNVGDGTEF